MNKSSSSNKSQTDWERLEAMEDENIDLSDIPELTPEMFAKAVVKRGLEAKESLGCAKQSVMPARRLLRNVRSQ